MCFTTAFTALSIPRFKSMGLAPAVTFLRPSVTMAWVRMVAVVVPSPASSPVLEATLFTSWAPVFSKWSSNSISLATVTPSFVIWGAPNFFSITTLRPLGPSVTFTASASWSTPRFIRSRASVLNLISFAIILLIYLSCFCLNSCLFLYDGEHVRLAHHQIFNAVKLQFCTAIFAIQHGVAFF